MNRRRRSIIIVVKVVAGLKFQEGLQIVTSISQLKKIKI